ncbi:hypothetical protein DFH09DRAFT_1095915 [Mycena vulgaris]|nr:hypothetical protein DFH09DRAFT_1095915 [Mycena vulgaris]
MFAAAIFIIAAAIFTQAAAIFTHAAPLVLVVPGNLKVVCGNLGVTQRQCDMSAAIFQLCRGSRACCQRQFGHSNYGLDTTSFKLTDGVKSLFTAPKPVYEFDCRNATSMRLIVSGPHSLSDLKYIKFWPKPPFNEPRAPPRDPIPATATRKGRANAAGGKPVKRAKPAAEVERRLLRSGKYVAATWRQNMIAAGCGNRVAMVAATRAAIPAKSSPSLHALGDAHEIRDCHRPGKRCEIKYFSLQFGWEGRWRIIGHGTERRRPSLVAGVGVNVVGVKAVAMGPTVDQATGRGCGKSRRQCGGSGFSKEGSDDFGWGERTRSKQSVSFNQSLGEGATNIDMSVEKKGGSRPWDDAARINKHSTQPPRLFVHLPGPCVHHASCPSLLLASWISSIIPETFASFIYIYITIELPLSP